MVPYLMYMIGTVALGKVDSATPSDEEGKGVSSSQERGQRIPAGGLKSWKQDDPRAGTSSTIAKICRGNIPRFCPEACSSVVSAMLKHTTSDVPPLFQHGMFPNFVEACRAARASSAVTGSAIWLPEISTVWS